MRVTFKEAWTAGKLACRRSCATRVFCVCVCVCGATCASVCEVVCVPARPSPRDEIRSYFFFFALVLCCSFDGGDGEGLSVRHYLHSLLRASRVHVRSPSAYQKTCAWVCAGGHPSFSPLLCRPGHGCLECSRDLTVTQRIPCHTRARAPLSISFSFSHPPP